MSRTATAPNVLDFNRPDTVKAAGGELEQTTVDLVQRLIVCEVTDIASCEQAVLDRQALGEAHKRVEAWFAPVKKAAHDVWKMICAREAAVLAPIDTLDRQKQAAIRMWKAEQDRLREQRERELAEEQRTLDEARVAAEAAALEASGDHEMAVAVLEEQLAAPLPVVALPTVKQQVAGLKTVRRWLWRYTGGPNDLKQTAPMIVARSMKLVPREYLKLDETKISATVRAMKGSIKIPGIEVYYVDDPVR